MAEKDAELGPYRRSDIATCGIPLDKIPDLVICERIDFSKEENVWKVFKKQDTYTHDELFSKQVFFNGFIEAPLDMVFEYLENVYSLEEWTGTLRTLLYMGGGLYKGFDYVVENTEIYLKVYANREAGVIDHYCAWDQGDDLFMRYHFRLLDGMKTVNKPGTMLVWFNARHPYYDRDSVAPAYIDASRNRKDRFWVGDKFPMFRAAHEVEFTNLKRILEYRYRNGHPLVTEGISAQKAHAMKNAR